MRAKLESRTRRQHPYVQHIAKLVVQHRSKFDVVHIDAIDGRAGVLFVDLTVKCNPSHRTVTLVLNNDDVEDLSSVNTLSDVERFMQQLSVGNVTDLPGCFILDATEKPLLRSAFVTDGLELIVVFNRSGWCHMWNRGTRNSSVVWTYFQSLQLSEQPLTHLHYDPVSGEVIAIEELLPTDTSCTVVSKLWVCSLTFPSHDSIELSKRTTLSTFPGSVLHIHCDGDGGIWVIGTTGQVYYYDFASGRSYGGCSLVWNGAHRDDTGTPVSCVSTIEPYTVGASTSRLYAVYGHRLQVFAPQSGQLRRLCAYDLRRILRSRKHVSHAQSVLDITTVVIGREHGDAEYGGREDCDVVALLTQTECLLIHLFVPTEVQEREIAVSQCIALPLPRARRRGATRDAPGTEALKWRFVHTAHHTDGRDPGSRADGEPSASHRKVSLCTITDGCRDFDVSVEGVGWSTLHSTAELWSQLFRPDQPWLPSPPHRPSESLRYDADDSFLRRYLLAEREALHSSNPSYYVTDGHTSAVQELCSGRSGLAMDRAMMAWSRAHSDTAPEVLSIAYLRGLAEELACMPEVTKSMSSKQSGGPAAQTQNPLEETKEWSWLPSFDPLPPSRDDDAIPVRVAAQWSTVLDPLLLIALVEAVSDQKTSDKVESADTTPSQSGHSLLQLALRAIFHLYPQHFEDIMRFLRQQEDHPRRFHELRTVRETDLDESSKGEAVHRRPRPVLREPKLVHSVGAAPPRLPPAPMTLQVAPPVQRQQAPQHADIGEDDDIFGLSSQLMREARAIPTPSFSFIPDRYGRAHRNLAQTVVEDSDGRRWLATGAGAKGSVFRPLPGSEIGGNYSDTESEHSNEEHQDNDDAFGIFRDVGGDSATEIGSPRARSHASTPRALHLEDLAVTETAGTGVGTGLNDGEQVNRVDTAAVGRDTLSQRLMRAVSPLLSPPVQSSPHNGATAVPEWTLLNVVVAMAENTQRLVASDGSSALAVDHHQAMCRVLLTLLHCPVEAVSYLSAVRRYQEVFHLTLRLCAAASALEASTEPELGSSTASTPTPKPTSRFAPLRKARSMEGLETVSDWEALLGYVAATTESLVEGSLTALVVKLSGTDGATSVAPALTARQISVLEAIVALKIAIKCLLSAPMEDQAMGLSMETVVANVLALLQARPRELTTEAVRAWVTVYAPTAELRRRLLCSTVFIP